MAVWFALNGRLDDARRRRGNVPGPCATGLASSWKRAKPVVIYEKYIRDSGLHSGDIKRDARSPGLMDKPAGSKIAASARYIAEVCGNM